MSKDLFAPPSDGELQQAKLFAPPSADELKQSATKPAMSPVDKAFSVAESAGSAVLEHPLVKGPIHWIGDKLERYVDAPSRAQIGALQEGKSLAESRKASWDQFGKPTLPTTVSAKEMMARTGLWTESLSDVAPGMFSETGEGLALKKGGVLDVSPAGVAGAIVQPSTWAIPGEAVLGAVSKTASVGGKLAGKALSPIGPLAETVKAATEATRRGVFNVGEVMTRGNLKAADAIKAAEKLSGTQLIAPDAYVKSAGKAVGAARDTIESAGHSLKAGEGARDALVRIRETVLAGQEKAAKTPGSQQLLDRVENALTHPDGVSVEAIDDMIRDLNGVEYTVLGNPKAIEPRWAKFTGQIRGELENVLKSTPEGAALSGAKEPFAALKTAQGKQRSGLATIASWTGGIPAAAATAVLGHPAIAALAAVTARAIAPRTYFQIVGATKLPSQAINKLMDAYASGKASVIGEAMTSVAEKYPQEMTKIATAVSAESGRVVENPMQRRIQRTGE